MHYKLKHDKSLFFLSFIGLLHKTELSALVDAIMSDQLLKNELSREIKTTKWTWSYSHLLYSTCRQQNSLHCVLRFTAPVRQTIAGDISKTRPFTSNYSVCITGHRLEMHARAKTNDGSYSAIIFQSYQAL